jgi:CarD family transcriptional regulator
MSFAVGDKVVYPHHGAAIIEGKEKRPFDGKKTDYFVLRITYGDLKVSIPVDKADEIGLREVINDEEVEEVFAVLRKKEARMPTNWSRRFKNHVEKLKSGDIYQVAEVVRNLSLREADKGLSAGEKRMLARARQILVSELTFALNVDEETAESRLDDVLAGRDVPTVRRRRRAPAKTAKRSPARKAAAKKAPAKSAAKKTSAKKALASRGRSVAKKK